MLGLKPLPYNIGTMLAGLMMVFMFGRHFVKYEDNIVLFTIVIGLCFLVTAYSYLDFKRLGLTYQPNNAMLVKLLNYGMIPIAIIDILILITTVQAFIFTDRLTIGDVLQQVVITLVSVTYVMAYRLSQLRPV